MTEEQLSRAWEEQQRLHTRETRNLLVEHYLPLAHRLAGKFTGRGIDREDLEQTAAMALLKAVDSFDRERGFEFITYAAPTISGALRNLIRDRAGLIRPSRQATERLARLWRVRERFEQEHYRSPTPLELARETEMDLADVVLLLSSNPVPISLDSFLGPEEEETLEALLGQEDEGFSQAENREWLNRLQETWSEQEKTLFDCRYRRNLNQRDTARVMEISQMQVSRLERRLLNRLRAEMKD